MAFTFPKIFSRKKTPSAPQKAKPAYSPQTEQEITQSMFNLALAGPRWIGEQMGEDLDEAFEAGDTGVSVLEFIKHPIKTTKSTFRKWTVSKWKNAIRAELVAEYVWKPRLEHFVAQGKLVETIKLPELTWGEKEEWLKKVQPELLKERPDIGYEAIWYREQEKLSKQVERALGETDLRKKEKEITKVWEDLKKWAEQGEAFGISDENIRILKGEKEVSLAGDVLDWASKPEGYGRDVAFEKLEELHGQGKIADDVWSGIRRQHSWDEFSRFRRRPGRYLWEKTFGKGGEKGIAPFYKYSPQKLIGEQIGKELAKTGLGKAIAVAKQKLADIARTVVATAKQTLKAAAKAVVKVAVQGAKWVVTKVAGTATWAAISSAVGGAIGTVGGPIGTVIGFLAGPVVFKTAEWIIKISCLTCGCATLMFAGSMIALLVSVFGAFRPQEMGGGVEERIVRLNKIAAPSRVELAATKPIVDYEIRFVNESDGELTNVVLVDRYDKNNFTPFALGGATNDAVNGTLTWNLGTIGPAGDGWVAYDGFINASDGVDKIVMNTATLAATTTEGENVSATAIGIVIVGNPSGQPPSGWPTAKGCVTQGPGGSYSHTGADAVDVGKLAGEESETYKVYATHDGVAYAWVGPDGPLSSAYGKYVEVVSHGGTFRTYYCHLFSHSIATGGVAVDRGSELGVMGATGSTDGGVHVHYEFRGVYENEPLDMEPPYIPSEIGSCSGRAECGCCFTSRSARCGQ